MGKVIKALLALAVLCGPAWAQSTYPSQGGANVPAAVVESLDGSGKTVPASSTNPLPVVVNTWAGGALGAMSNYGTSPGAVLVPGVNAFVTNPVTAVGSGANTNPTSTLLLPSTTTAYTAGQLICTNATVATCNTALASQFFSIANAAGSANIPRLRLTTNDATSTAWGGQTITIDLWSAAPTFATTGDRASFTTDFLTGSAGHLGAFSCVMSAELADGAYAECAPTVGSFATPKLASGTSIFWTDTATTGSGVTGASKTFTLTAELLN